MIIRSFRKSDALGCYLLAIESQIKELSKYYSRKLITYYVNRFSLRKLLSKKGNRITLVAVMEKEIVGYIDTKVKKKSAKVGRLFVSIKLLGKGIGTKLYKKTEGILKKRGIKKIWVNSSISPLTVKFYEKLGFKNLGRKNIRRGKIRVPIVRMVKYL